MKVLVKAFALTVLLAVPAAAQTGGNIGGVESRGEPLGSSYKASAVDRNTGYTPGRNYGTVKVKKSKKKKKVTVVR
jgi:hypothetical protein